MLTSDPNQNAPQYEDFRGAKENHTFSDLIDHFRYTLSRNKDEAESPEWERLKESLIHAEGRISKSFNKVLSINKGVSAIQSLVISGKRGNSLFEGIIKEIVEATDSICGFIEVFSSPDQSKTFSYSLFKEELSFENFRKGTFISPVNKFSLLNLLNQSNGGESSRYTVKKITFSDENKLDQGCSFLTYPLKQENQIIGIIALANKNESFDDYFVDLIEPLFKTCLSILQIMLAHGHIKLELELPNEVPRSNEEKLQETLDNSVALNEKLIESETRLKEAQEIAKLARWEFLVGKGSFIWSKEMYELYGERSDMGTLFKDDPLALIYSEDRGKLLEQGKLAIQYKKDFNFDVRINKKDGTLAWIVGKGKPVMNEDGQLLKFVGIAMDISERKDAELAIERSEHLFKALIQNSSDFVHLVNKEGIITYESPAIEKILGYSPEEVLGKNIFDLLHPEDIERYRSSFEALKECPGESALLEVRIKHKLGKWIWLESLGTNLFDNPGVNAFVYNNRDITDRKLAEEEIERLLEETQIINLELRASEMGIRQSLEHSVELNQKLIESQEQLKEAQSIAKLGRWEIDFIENKNTWSDEVYKIFGYQDNTIEIKTEIYFERIYPEFRNTVAKIIDNASELGRGFKQEVKIKTLNGDKWIYLIGKPVVNNGGVVTKLVIVVIDISERKQAEIALQVNEKLFRQLIENSQDGIFLLDNRSRVIYASPSSSKILGYSVHEILDNPNGLGFVHPDFRDYVHTQYQELYTKPGGVMTLIYLTRHKNGSWKWIENTAKNLLNDPDINSIVINARDVTIAKEAQIALENRERRFRKLIENSHDSVAISNEVGKTIYLSESVQNILGFTAEEVLQRENGRELLHPDEIQMLYENRMQLLAKPDNISTALFRTKHKDGNWRWIESVSRNLLHDPDVQGIVNNFRDVTERKASEEALKESERKYRMLMEEASDGIFLTNNNQQYISVNNRGCQMLGYSREEVMSLSIYDLFPESEEINRPLRTEELKQGKSLLTERLMRRRDGSLFPVEISAKKLDENTFQAFVRDITERRKSEELIKKSEAELNALFHALPDLIMVFNSEGIFLRISSHIPDLFYPPGDNLIGKSIFEVLPQSEALHFEEYIRKVLEIKEGVLQTEYSIEYNGERIWFAANVSLMSDNQVVWVARDTTQRKRAEEELINSKNYLDKIINTIPEPVFVKDKNHKWILLNDALCEYLGHSRKDLLGKSDFDFFPPEVAQDFHNKDEIVLATGEDDIMEEELMDFRGDKRTLVIKKSLYNDPQRGELVVGIINDITARKKIEKKLQNQNEELTKINAELDKFVYRASHDLRAPLVSILGLINIAKMENNLQKNIEYFGLMEKSINKLDNFIQSIIHYSRNSRLEVIVEKIDLQKLILETFDDLKYIEASKRIKININITGEVVFFSDLFRLKIIFNNMISNAIRYSNPRQDYPYLNINILIDHVHARIEFEDNGIGIAEGSVGRIFEMFYRASSTNVGSGLGLYIVKDVVETMKGTIEVKSILGQGTTFIIDIPNSNQNKVKEN